MPDTQNYNTNLVDGPVTVGDVAVAATTTTAVLAQADNIAGCWISNKAANATVVRVGDASTGAARGIELPIGGSIYMPGTGPFHVYNPSAGSINIGVAYNTSS